MVSHVQVRSLINGRLRTDADFNAFCHDCFPAVFQRYSDGMDRLAKTNLLIQLADDPEQIVRSLETWIGQLRAYPQRRRSWLMFGSSLLLGGLLVVSLLRLFGRPNPSATPALPRSAAHAQQPNRSAPEPSESPLPRNGASNQCKEPPGATQPGTKDTSKTTIINMISGDISTLIQNY